MTRLDWFRRHRVLTAFAAGVLLTLIGLAVTGYLIVSDQRRSARVLAAALSRALAREVRIDRVTAIGTQHVVIRGIELPPEGGWPARVVVDRVEATGPLLAAARGDAAPVRLTVSRPTVELKPAGGGGFDLAAVDAWRQSLRDFLAGPLTVDVALTAGVARHGGGTTDFDLSLRKAAGVAKAELTLREPRVAPLVVTMTGKAEGQAAGVALTGRGGLVSLASWLPARSATALRERTLDLALELDLPPGQATTARGRIAIGDTVVVEGTAVVKDGAVEATLPSATADLAFAAAVAGLDWTPTGRVELSQATARWRPGGEGPTLRAGVRAAALSLPAAGVGVDVSAQRLEGRLALDPDPAGAALSGDVRATQLAVAGVEVAPVETRYRLALAGGQVKRLALDGLVARVEGADLRGTVGYDPGAGRVEARVEGQDVEASGLIRRLAPGFLDAGERVRLAGLTVTTPGLDPRGWRSGAVRLEGRGLRWQRSAGAVSATRLDTRAELKPAGAAVSLDAERVVSTLPALPAELPRVTGSAELARGADGKLGPQRGTLTARDGQGRDLVVAGLEPSTTAGRLRLSARAPALERLDTLWSTVPRRLTGSARLDVEVTAADLGAADGRLALDIPEGELQGGKISVREVTADVPLRRGAFLGEPPWGRLQVGELIGYGVVVRDLVTPARVVRDRLSLNALSYALYSGSGKGWAEVEADAGGLAVRGQLTGEGVRIEEFIASYGVRGGTMTGLMRYALDHQYRAGRLTLKGRFDVPEGGAVNIELLNRLLAYADVDATGVVRRALENLREFDYKSATVEAHTAGNDILASLAMQGRERFKIFPPRVKAITVKDMPLSFVARQFPGAAN
jgi:hypothetical protein